MRKAEATRRVFAMAGLILTLSLLGCGSQIRSLNGNLSIADVVPPGFVDLFNGSIFDSVWDESPVGFRVITPYNPAIGFSPSGGRLVITLDPTMAGYKTIVTADSYDFSGAFASVELVQPPADASTVSDVGLWVVQGDHDQALGWQITKMGTGLYFVYFDGASWDFAAPNQMPFDSIAHRFLRIRHDADLNSMVMESSPDEITWTELRAKPILTEDVRYMRMSLYGGNWAVEASPSPPVEFDNFRTDAAKN